MLASGPGDARIMIVGEFPDERDVYAGRPFSGPAGMELGRMLQEAGIGFNECFLTNLCASNPPWSFSGNPMDEWISQNVNAPKGSGKVRNLTWVKWRGVWAHPAVVEGYEQLVKHVQLVKPTIIIALGNGALFALTGKWGIKAWRGSMLMGKAGTHECKVIPTYAPSAVNRDWSVRSIAVHDLRRVKAESDSKTYVVPNNTFIIRPNFAEVINEFARLRKRLNAGDLWLSTDIETRAGHIACIGWADSKTTAFCLPLMCREQAEGYWTLEEEMYIWSELRRLFSNPRLRIIGQNWLYDSQYIYRFFFVKVPVAWDTMITQHCMFPGTPKGLDYLASLYCENYVYWKGVARTDTSKAEE